MPLQHRDAACALKREDPTTTNATHHDDLTLPDPLSTSTSTSHQTCSTSWALGPSGHHQIQQGPAATAAKLREAATRQSPSKSVHSATASTPHAGFTLQRRPTKDLARRPRIRQPPTTTILIMYLTPNKEAFDDWWPSPRATRSGHLTLDIESRPCRLAAAGARSDPLDHRPSLELASNLCWIHP
jgi:hypothetical protein